MKEFKMYADIVYHDSFQEFMEGENVGAEDFILTNEFLYNQYVKPLNPNCGSLFIEAYGKGEPTTEMVDEIKKAIPAGVKRLIAVGGGSVIDIAKDVLPACFLQQDRGSVRPESGRREAHPQYLLRYMQSRPPAAPVPK